MLKRYSFLICLFTAKIFPSAYPNKKNKDTKKNKHIISMILSGKKKDIQSFHILYKNIYSEQENLNKTINPVYEVSYKL